MYKENFKELLPNYLRFVEGVVDSEDIPLNVSRESVQATRVMVNLKKLVTSKVIDTLKRLDKNLRMHIHLENNVLFNKAKAMADNLP